MEGVSQAGSGAADKNLPVSQDTSQGGSHDGEQPARAPVAGPSKPKKSKKPWRDGYVCPKLSQNKRKQTSEEGDTPEPELDVVGDTNAARAPSPSTCSSDDSSKSDDDGNQSEESSKDSSSDDDSDHESVKPPPAKKARVTTGSATYSRFDPGEGDQVRFVFPSADMADYITRMFSSFISDKKLKETIMSDYPVPSDVPGLQVPEMDEYIAEIFAVKKQDFGKSIDDNWAKVQSRVLDIMGPLGKLWTLMETARLDDSEEIDLFEALELVEKIITLLGQAFGSCSYFRRTNVLYRMTRCMKKAKSLLKQHSESLVKSHDKLFGKPFYKQLTKAAKIRKESKEISHQLGESKPKNTKKTYNNSNNAQKQSTGNTQQSDQPFRGGPSSSRGGGRKSAFSKKGKANNKGKCFVKLNFCHFKRDNKYSSDRLEHRRRQSRPCKLARSGKAKSVSFIPDRPEGHGLTPRGNRITSRGLCLVRQSGGEAARVCYQLAVTDTGHTDTADCAGATDPLCDNAPPREGATSVPLVQDRLQSDHGRDREHAPEGCCQGGLTLQRPVCESPLSCPQERRDSEACNKSEEFECSRGLFSLQDGRATSPERVDTTSGLHDKSRPKGCLLQCPSGTGVSSLSEVSLGGEVIPVRVHAIRTGPSPQAVHQAVEAGDSSSTSSRCENYNIPGRHDHPQSEQGRSAEGPELSTLLANAIRVCHKLEEVLPSSDPDLGFLGVHHRYYQDDYVLAPREGHQDHRQMSENDLGTFCQSQNDGRVSGPPDFLSEGHTSCPTALQTNANGSDQSPVAGAIIRSYVDSHTGGLRGTPLVDPECQNLEWESDYHPLPGPVNRDGRLVEWLGSGPEGPEGLGVPGQSRRKASI